MAIGYFLCVDDKTSCGGSLLEGYDGWMSNGKPRARAGDAVTCGLDGKVYRIDGGVPFQILGGQPAAGTLDSVSNCPCNASLIPTHFSESYTHQSAASPSYEFTPFAIDPPSPAPWAPPASESAVSSSLPIHDTVAQEPGFYIVPRNTSYEALESELFESPSAAVLHKFRSLNPRRGQIKAGELIVLSDPNNQQCTYEESLLMEVAAQLHVQLADITPEVANFSAQHHETIRHFLDYGSKGLGIGEAMLGQRLKAIEALLKQVDDLHVRTFVLRGNLRSADFLTERKRLLTLLDAQLSDLTRKGVGISNHPKLKTALGISSRSLVHHWTKAGAPGQIPGYAKHYAGVARAGAYLMFGGYIIIGLSALASYLKVQEVCRAGETEACKRIRVIEGGAFAGAVAGGIAGGVAGVKAAGLLCLGFGVGGVLICGIAVAGTSSYALSTGGGVIGESLADYIYGQIE